MKNLTISIIIPVYKESNNLNICLQALDKAKKRCNYNTEVIVVDDHSPNHKEIEKVANACNCIYHLLDENSGPAKARNTGVKMSKGEVLYFVDSDVVMFEDCLKKVGDFFCKRANEYVALIGSYCKETASDDFPSNFKNLMHHYVHQNSNTEAPHFWTGCGAVLKNDFEQLGGFDISYKDAIVEDVEFGYRLKGLNKRIYLDKKLQVKHLKKYSLWKLFKSDFFNRAIPLSRLILKRKYITNDQDTPTYAKLSTVLIFIFPILVILSFVKYPVIFWILALAAILGIAILNSKFISLTIKERKALFGLQSILYLNFYYFYCGTAFLISCIEYYPNKIFRNGN